MRKLLLVLCILLIAPSISAQIWLPMTTDLLNLESFRHQATATIEDDLDNGVDGTDIFAVDGARIYTNLSNLVSGAEHQGNNSYSANTVLIGATSPIYKGWKVTAFYGNENYNYGSSSDSTSNTEQDTGGTDAFDVLTTSHSTSSYNYYAPGNAMLINIGKEMGEETAIALTYKRSTGENKYENDYTQDYTVTDLNNNDILALWDRFGNGDSTITTPTDLYSLSYCTPFRNWQLRGDVIFLMGGEKNNSESLDYFFQDNDPDDLSTTDTDLDSTVMANQDDYNGNLIGVGLQLSDENEQTGLMWEVGGNYGMVFGSGDYQDLTRGRNIDNRMTLAGDVSELNVLSISNAAAPISVSGSAMGLNGRIEWQISENVRFGTGLIANSFSTELEYDEDISNRSVRDYDDGDTEVDDTDDYVRTSVSGQTRVRTIKTTSNRIVVPAGVEVNFGKNKDWYMRLGAVATGSKSENTNIIDVTSVQRDSTITVLGDNSSTVTVGSSINYTDTESKSSSAYQSVDYVYGLGWKPSPNLSIDLVGMFDFSGVELLSTDWLRSLKLSATINIY